MSESYIAIDIGATNTRISLCDRQGLLEKMVYSTPREGDEYTIARFICEKIVSKWRDELNRVETIGVATIGPLDIKQGRVVNTPNIPIRNFEIIKPITKTLRKPVYVANDCVASVWGEKIYGDGRGVSNLIYLTLSTGIGAGIVVDDNLLIGKMGNAHEIGHIVVDFNSQIKCGCGGRGHWEAFAGGANLPRVAKYVLLKDRSLMTTELGKRIASNESVTSKDIFDYYRKGDRLSIEVIELYIKATAAGIASIINAYDPEVLIMGGSVFLNNMDILLEPILEVVKDNIVTGMPIMKPTKFADDVGLYGALALANHTPQKIKQIQDHLINEALAN
ncbi:MAG: ROK family protein [Desulfurococcaceae archaeon]